jgi:hypothetical protein
MADGPVKILWSLAANLGGTIAAAGNSGSWQGAGPGNTLPAVDNETPVDLRLIDDLALYVFVTAIVSSPSLTVQIDGYDDQGNLFPAISGTPAAITAAGHAAPVYIGKHGGTAGSYVVLPLWGRVSWAISGGSVTGTEICLLGR